MIREQLPLSIANDRIIASIQKVLEESLIRELCATEISVLLAKHEEVYFLYVLSALAEFAKGAISGNFMARILLQRAKQWSAWASPWEQSYHEIVSVLCQRKFTKALILLEKHLLEWPWDLFALRCVEIAVYLRGELADPSWFEKIVERSYFSCQENDYYIALYSRALFLSGKRSLAKKMAEKSNGILLGVRTHIDILFEEKNVSIAKNKAVESNDPLSTARCLLALGQIEDAQRMTEAIVEERMPLRDRIRCVALLAQMEAKGASIEWRGIGAFFPHDFDRLLVPCATAFHFFLLKNRGESAHSYLLSLTDEVGKLTGEERSIWDKIGLPLLTRLGGHNTTFQYHLFFPRIGCGPFEISHALKLGRVVN